MAELEGDSAGDSAGDTTNTDMGIDSDMSFDGNMSAGTDMGGDESTTDADTDGAPTDHTQSASGGDEPTTPEQDQESENEDAVGTDDGLESEQGPDAAEQEEEDKQEGETEQPLEPVVNHRGEEYPEVIDPRTGEPIPPPEGDLEIVPQEERVPWGISERRAFIEEWEAKGYPVPEGGWSEYDIHHIRPREYGGTNDFDNLVPVPRSTHQGQLNPWWSGFNRK